MSIRRQAVERKPPEFARVLGKSPLMAVAKYSCLDSQHLLSEAFGPPELRQREKSSVIYWNFSREDGASGFTLLATIPSRSRRTQIEIRLAANAGVRSFISWTIDRLSAIEGGEELPLFLGAGQFVARPIR
jgi:hypothetical protein